MSSWPVITEVCHLVPTTVVPRILEWIRLGGLHLLELPVTALATIEEWMVRYGNLPMNLADASLLWLAHQSGIRRMPRLISELSASTNSPVVKPWSMWWRPSADPMPFGPMLAMATNDHDSALDGDGEVCGCSRRSKRAAIRQRCPAKLAGSLVATGKS